MAASEAPSTNSSFDFIIFTFYFFISLFGLNEFNRLTDLMDILSIDELKNGITMNGLSGGALKTLNISRNMMKMGCVQGKILVVKIIIVIVVVVLIVFAVVALAVVNIIDISSNVFELILITDIVTIIITTLLVITFVAIVIIIIVICC